MVRLFLKWMSIPTILLMVLVVYYSIYPDWQATSDVPSDFATVVADKKLKQMLNMSGPEWQHPKTTKDFGPNTLKIEMFIKEKQLIAMRDPANKDKFKNQGEDFIIRVNQGQFLVANFKLRGMHTLAWAYNTTSPPRLNYTVTLFNPIELRPGLQLAKFYLMNMIFDPHQVKMEFSYRFLSRLNLFFAHTQFVVLYINGVPHGIYLLIEPYKDAIRREFKNIIGIYRRTRKGFLTKHQERQRIDQWHVERLDDIIRRYKGPKLLETLNEIINLDAYLTWLAFNSALKNSGFDR